MKSNVLKCPNCGAPVEIENDLDVFFCKYCGYKIILEGQTDAVINAKVRLKDMEHKEKMWDKKYNYEKYKGEQKRKCKKSKTKRIIILSITIPLVFLMLFASLFYSIKLSSDNEEKELQKTVDEIMIDIKNEDYEEAYVKANSLYYTSDWSNEIKNKWDNTRKSVIEQIEKAEKKTNK